MGDRGEIHQRADDESWGPSISASLSDCSIRSGRLVNVVSTAVDSRSIQARCSVKAIHDIISRFYDRIYQKENRVWCPIKSTNRGFSAWLMGMVDVRNSCLEQPDRSSLKFYSNHVAIVFGIPATGKKVNEAGQLHKWMQFKFYSSKFYSGVRMAYFKDHFGIVLGAFMTKKMYSTIEGWDYSK